MEARKFQCDKVVSLQVDTDLWTDVGGKEQSEACTRSYTPFMYCVTLHLQMVFAEDVLVRVGIACALIATLSVIGAIAAIMLKLLGFSTPGWFSVALGILVLMLLQTGALALMTLMLTGVIRSGTVATAVAYHDFIESVTGTIRSVDKT